MEEIPQPLVDSPRPNAGQPFWKHPLCTVLLLVLSGILLLIPLPQEGRVLDALGDMLHGPLFALLAVVLQVAVLSRFFRNPWGAGLATWLIMSALGILSEIAQLQVGREGSVEDALADVLGAAAGACLGCSLFTVTTTSRRSLRAMAIILLGIGAWTPARILYDSARQKWQFPVIASFEDRLEMTRWNPHDSSLSRERKHATDGEWAFQVEIQQTKYPGAILRWPVPDWRGYTALSFDAACEEGRELELTVKIQDADHINRPEDRFQKRIGIGSAMKRFEIPLEEVVDLRSGREMDLSRVDLLQFYISKPSEPRTFYVDNIRLE